MIFLLPLAFYFSEEHIYEVELHEMAAATAAVVSFDMAWAARWPAHRFVYVSVCLQAQSSCDCMHKCTTSHANNFVCKSNFCDANASFSLRIVHDVYIAAVWRGGGNT